MNLRTGSFCSGICAPEVAWRGLGWDAQFFSEIDPFACAVEAHHFPGVPNLGDMEKITDEQIAPFIGTDVVVAGTPCQSFSVAGLRGGMADPRGNLALILLRLVDRLRPRWLVWENVPGFLSVDGGDTARAFLDAIEELEYIIDIDILDAQFNGVPQRRRRIFICAQSVETLLRSKTNSSALTIAQCLAEISQSILTVFRDRSASERVSSESLRRSEDGLRRRMKLFGLQRAERLAVLRENLDAWSQRLAAGPENSGYSGDDGTDSSRTTGARSWTSEETPAAKWSESLSIGKLWPDINGVLSLASKLSTTSTVEKTITTSEIFTCSRVVLSIGRLIALSNPSCPPFWSAASSALIALQEFIAYARSTTSSLFGDLEWFQSWCDFIGEAQPAIESLKRFGIENFGKVFPLADCLSGNFAPSREAGTRVAAGLTRGADGSGAGGYAGRRREDDSNIVASEDGTGRGTPIIPTLYRTSGNCGVMEQGDKSAALTTSTDPNAQILAYQCHGSNVGEMGTLRAGNGNEGGGVRFITAPVAFAQNTRDEVRLIGGDGQMVGALAAEAGMKQQNYIAAPVGYTVHGSMASEVASEAELSGCLRARTSPGSPENSSRTAIGQGMAVRRLLPVECEKLQGFPPGFTAVTYRGKPAADGNRYRAIGNSMAVPVLRWLGERIQLVDSIPSLGQTALDQNATTDTRSDQESDGKLHVREGRGTHAS